MTIYEYNTKLNAERLPVLAERARYQIDGRRAYNSPDAVADLARDVIGLGDAAEEYAYCIALDVKNRIIGLFEVGHGGLDFSTVDVRGTFQKLLMLGAARFFFVHNHPSGDCTPSQCDNNITAALKAGGDLLRVQMLDRVIVSYCDYYSYQSNNAL